jgi:hypothetical protein
VSALLQLIGEASDDQIATEPQGRSGMMQCLPRNAAAPVSTDQSIRQSRIQGRTGPGLADGRSGRYLYRERATARQSAGEPKYRGLEIS